MLFGSTVLAFSVLCGHVLAQSRTQSTGAAVATHVFAVGAQGKTFTPNHMNIPVGDIAEFRFYPQNHSVVKGEFQSEPCIPYEQTGAGKVGWWSGWMPTAVVDTANQPTFRIRINDTSPLAVYCSSPGSCLLGMLAVINGNATHNIDTQLENARKGKVILSPGEYFPEEKASDVEQTRGGTNSATNEKSSSGKLSTGAIAGIAVGGAVVIALAGALIYMCGRHKSFKDLLKSNSNSNTNKDHVTYEPASPGFSEANYPNMAKSPAMTDSRFSAMSYNAAYSDRSVSPPLDERSQSLYGVLSGGHSPSMQGSQWPAPAPRYEEVHEADSQGIKRNAAQVHEMSSDASVPTSAIISPGSPVRPYPHDGDQQTIMSSDVERNISKQT